MGKLKIAELVILAISALISIAKYIIKFIDYLGRLLIREPATSTA